MIGTIALVGAFSFPRFFGHDLRWIEIVVGAEFFALAASMLVYSKFGKMAIPDAILDSIPWRGNERVLDVGCGRGLLLIGAAVRLPRGLAVGLDKRVRGCRPFHTCLAAPPANTTLGTFRPVLLAVIVISASGAKPVEDGNGLQWMRP